MMADKDMALEFAWFIENDGQLYRSQTQSIIHNYAIKKIKGIYDAKRAITGWLNLVENGIRKYKKEFPGYYKIDKGTKILVAKHLAMTYAEEIAMKVKKMRTLKKAGKPWQRR